MIVRAIKYVYRKFWGGMNYIQDLMYVGHSLGGTYFNRKIKEAGGKGCQSSDYRAIKTFLNHCPISDTDVIVDLGCGKGRLFHYLCAKGFRGKCVGIELWKEVALKTQKDMEKYDNVTIVHNNFLNYDFPQDFTIVYYFNPANREVTGELIKNLESYEKKFKFVYINALYADLMEERRGWSISYEFDTRYRLDIINHCIIFEYNPA